MDRALMSFLAELATSPRQLAAYAKDRESYLDHTRLSPEAKSAVLRGDRDAIALLAAGGRAADRETPRRTRPTYMKKAKKKTARKKAARKKTAKKR